MSSADADVRQLSLPLVGGSTKMSWWRRVIAAVETSWYGTVMLFNVIWLLVLDVLGRAADYSSGWTRICAMVFAIAVMIWMSVEAGARFRALNDRSASLATIVWAALTCMMLGGLAVYISEPIKGVLKANPGRYDGNTAVAFFVWLALYAAVMKLPWDRACDLRKASHQSWRKSARSRHYRVKAGFREAARLQDELREHQRRDAEQSRASWAELYPKRT